MRLCRQLRQHFKTLTPQDYLFNQRQAICAQTTRSTQLKPLPLANQGDIDLIDEVQLIGLPKAPVRPVQDLKDQVQVMAAAGVDLIFLQIDPSDYMARQRYLSHKCAMGGVEDYRLDGVELIDPHRPISWEETVVNLFTLDMLVNNSLPNKTSYITGLYAYSYPFVKDPVMGKQIQAAKQRQITTKLFKDVIGQHILGGKRSENYTIDRFLYSSLMGRHKVMLGGMPETLYKMILGKSLSIHELRDIFRTIVVKNKQLTTPFTISEAAKNFMPHIFLLPKDLYMSALLKQSFQAATQMVCAVGMEHYRPIQQYWVGPPHGVNMTDATKIPDGFPGQTTTDYIEKQAILDVLLETRTWSKPYLSNPFPYLFQDVTKVSKPELDKMKNIFLQQYKKYSEFKNRELKQLPMKDAKGLLTNQQQEQLQKTMVGLENSHKLSHVKQKMSIKMEKSFQEKAKSLFK